MAASFSIELAEDGVTVHIRYDGPTEWWSRFHTALAGRCPTARHDEPKSLTLEWADFSRVALQLRSIIELSCPNERVQIQVSDGIRSAVTRLRDERRVQRDVEPHIEVITPEQVSRTLVERGFRRTLKPYQLRNVARLAALPNGASFSVPGSGKTTEALATLAMRSYPDSTLLVVCPRSAFAAWEEEVQETLPDLRVTRLVGGTSAIQQTLQVARGVLLIGYQQLAICLHDVSRYMARNSVVMVLDESHRIKRGDAGVWASAVLNIAHLAQWRMVLTGTPMPNTETDLLPQLRFLYPGFNTDVDPTQLREIIRPYYVRTTKAELGLPVPNATGHLVRMTEPQYLLYRLAADEAIRRLAPALRSHDRIALRRAGASYQILLQITSNPALLTRSFGRLGDQLLERAIGLGSPKVDWVCQRTRELAAQDNKVLIWTNFVGNVQLLAARLADLGAVAVHGSVLVGSEDDENTREGRIRRFKHDANCMVMVANPQTCAEAISLHTACHHAIYLDRSYNATHYLQSQDRIHRIGLPEGTETHFELVSCANTIDESVERRLAQKLNAMRALLDDPTIGVDIHWREDEEDFDADDAADLLRTLNP